MKKRLMAGGAVILAATFLVACTPNPGTVTDVQDSHRVFVYTDEDRNVTCWVLRFDGGIDCIPNADLNPDPEAED